MAVRIPPAPPSSVGALHAVAPTLANSASVRRRSPQIADAFSRSPATLVAPVLSYRVYVLGLRDITAGNASLNTAVLAFWRHTIQSDGETVAADVKPGQAADTYTFAAINFGHWPASVKDAIDAQLSAPELAASSYQVSLVQVPALGVRAVWLQGAPGLVVPIAPTRPELTAGRRYSEEEFLAALQDPARRMLESDDPRKGA